MPLVLYGATPIERMVLTYNFSELEEAGALALCTTPESLTTTMLELAGDKARLTAMSAATESFLAKEFAFDAKGAERAARFIETITKRPSS